MKIILLIAALAGIALLLVTGMGTQRSSPESTASDLASGSALLEMREELRAMREELGGLRSEQREMAMRMATLESRPDPVAARTPVANEALPELEEVREMVAALKDPAKAAPGGLETLVLDVLDEKEEREAEARRLRREEVMQERLAQRVADLGEELGLSPYQEQEMLVVLTNESTRRDTFISEMRETGAWDRDHMRETMGELRNETMTALGGVLTPEQLDGYEKAEGDRGFGRGFGGGGGRGRDRNEEGRGGGGGGNGGGGNRGGN